MHTPIAVLASLICAPLAVAQPVVIDGDVSDWAEGERARCEAGWVKFRLDVGRPVSLHALPAPITVELEVFEAQRSLGEASIEFSPPPPADGSRRWGPMVTIAGIEIDAMDLDLHAAPTAASPEFEVRVGVDELLEAIKVASASRVEIRAVGVGLNAEMNVDLCPLVADTAGFEVPSAPEAGARVMSWNVLWSSPIESPEGFARIFDATRPDVVLFQEWDRGELSATDVAGWMNAHAAWAPGEWSVSKPDAWGVAVATFHPVVAQGPEQLLAPGSRWDFPVRFAGAVIDLPMGRTAVGSVHLKCCGSLGSDEDTRRLVESVAVRDTLIEMTDAHGAEHVILGGDFNTSGTGAILNVAAAGVDLDGSSLTYAEPSVTADEARYTFGRAGMNNTRSRLDWIGFSDSTLTEISSFVIDTARIDPASLGSMGLMNTDSASSDHLPVVLDVAPVN